MRDRRRAFALPGSSHDRLVRTLLRLLPAAVGAIFAVMIIAPLFPHGEISFLLDRSKVATTQQRLKVTKAMYRGEDNKGRPFSLTAGSAIQPSASQQLVTMTDLDAHMLLGDGPATLTAPDGTYDFGKSLVSVTGPVDFRAANGYRLVTSGVAISLKDKTITGGGGVHGAIPAGTFQADRIIADLDERQITLDGHARLQMVPGKIRMQP